MPKSRSSNNVTSSSSTTTTTTTVTISPTILHLNQHKRASSTTSSTSSNASHYSHNASYGLLEPAQTKRPTLHHRRKSSSSTGSISWSERGFDLSDLKDKSVGLGGRISERLPGVRYSATFISTLRTNLALSASLAPPSPSLHAFSPGLLPPTSHAHHTYPSAPARSTSMVSIADSSPLGDVPELTFAAPTNDEDKTAGLKLVADIYSQQRSTVSKILIYNPITALLLAVIIGGLCPFIYRDPSTDKPNLAIMVIGSIMIILAGVRYLVRPYQDAAETINWTWLGTDELLIAKFGPTVIGSVVYHLDGGNGRRQSNSKKLLLRAWTTRPRERGRGVGRGLLEKAVEIAKEKGCSTVEFAADECRVGTERFLSWLDGFAGIVHVNRGLEEEEIRARDALEHVLDERSEKRRRGSR